MPIVLKGDLAGAGRRFAVVASEFNENVVKGLVDGATSTLLRRGVKDEDITVAWVPGAFEIPAAARKLAKTGRFDAVVCVGAVIQGDTTHHVYVAENAVRGIADVSRDTGVPCTLGVVTAGTLKLALERAVGAVNRGAEAAEAALEMASLFPKLS
jgi:6,7-dimethyl-8-ribityllumazine synthase